MIQNSEILITGGYGFIGSHMAKSLAETSLGNSLTLFDTNTGPGTTGDDFNLDQYDNVTVVEGCVLEASDHDMLPRNFDYIVSAAGFLGIDKVAEQQLVTLDTNITGVRNCLELAAKHDEKPFVLLLSTSEIYGVDCAGPAEDYPATIPSSGARWGYATSKLADEYYLRAYNQAHGVPGGIVRPFNVFGPHRYGSNAMTALVTRAINDDELQISGDGQQVRSWCYIDDFCEGALRVLEHRSDEVEAFNIGDDRNVFTMAGLAEEIVRVADSQSRIRIMHNAREDVRFRVPNIDKARLLLSYEPQVDFEVAVNDVAKWVRLVTSQEYRDAA